MNLNKLKLVSLLSLIIAGSFSTAADQLNRLRSAQLKCAALLAKVEAVKVTPLTIEFGPESNTLILRVDDPRLVLASSNEERHEVWGQLSRLLSRDAQIFDEVKDEVGEFEVRVLIVTAKNFADQLLILEQQIKRMGGLLNEDVFRFAESAQFVALGPVTQSQALEYQEGPAPQAIAVRAKLAAYNVIGFAKSHEARTRIIDMLVGKKAVGVAKILPNDVGIIRPRYPFEIGVSERNRPVLERLSALVKQHGGVITEEMVIEASKAAPREQTGEPGALLQKR